MKRIILFIFSLLVSLINFAQNMSYTCPRDTTLGCNTPCFTITGKIPDIRSASTQYRIGNISDVVQPCIPNPDINGVEAFLNIIDDTYSNPLPIGFNFPFYGSFYSDLVASTNGYLSFDLARATLFSTWSLSAGDVPNTSYDGGLIMGPWHDLDPAYTTSPIPQGQQMKYSMTGAAPNRKWTLNFYRVPLFSTTCQNLYENTHRIVLHESTGLIEILIFDKQQCPTWNSGKSMVGIQDMTKTQGLMAPGRKASDLPWGSIGMNEVWRFVPAAGPTAYKHVELLDATGAVVAIGDTTRLDSLNFQVTFPNVCPPLSATNSLYVIKTTYKKIDNANALDTIFSLDTINVIRQAQLPVSATMTPTTCGGNTGSVTVSAAGTPGYQYAIDGGALQTSPLFINIGSGNHTVFAQDATGCNNTAVINVTSVSSLNFNTGFTNCSCPGRNDGTITVTPTLGTGPYTYSITGTNTYPNITVNGAGTFSNLPAGTYTITFTDANNCSGTTNPIVVTPGSQITSSYSTTSSCPSVNNGTATITPTSGTGPYTFSMLGYTGTNPPPGPSAYYTGLAGQGFSAPYNVTITDATGCTGSLNVYVYQGTGITSTSSNTPATCSSVSNGTITISPTSGSGPYNFSIDGGPIVPASNPPQMIFTGVAAGSHTVTITDASGCAGTNTVNVTAGTGVTGTATFTPASCANVSNGTITVTTTNGTNPLTYSLDGGTYQPPFSSTITFNNVSSGSHTIGILDGLGCSGTTSVTITAGAGISGTATSTMTSCPSVANGTITVTPSNGISPYTYSLDGGTGVTVAGTSHTINNVTDGAHIITVTDNLGCSGQVFSVVPAGPGLTSITNDFNPPCSNISNGTITIVPSVSGTYTYTLNPNTAQAITQTSATFINLAPGTYFYSFQSTSSGCSGSGSTTLTTNPPISTILALTMPLCNGQSNGIITVTPSGGVPGYTYSIDGGATYQPSNIFNTINAGAHTISIKDNAGCIKDTTITMSQPTVLQASATSTPGTCNGNDAQLTVTGTDGTPPYTYSINNGTSYQAAQLFIVNGGNYPDIKVKDANGCIASTSVNAVLNDNMDVTPVNDTTVCVESSVKLIPNFLSGATTTFNWSTIPNPALVSTLNQSNIQTPIATPTDTTTYVVHAQWGPCSRYDTITVRVLHKPIPDAGPGNIICQYASSPLIGSVSNTSGPVIFSWTPANTVHPPDIAITSADPFTTQIYTLTVTDDYGCNFSVTDTVRIKVQPPVPAFAGNDTIAVRNQPFQLSASGGPDVIAFSWTPMAPLSNSTIYNPVATLNDDQLFIVTITDSGHCIGKDSVFVRVYDSTTYYVPNAFSPNGDGLNDVFRAIPVGMTTTDYFRIFDRYGKMVFETNKYLKGWDGTYMGHKMPQGAYVWIVRGKYLDKRDNTLKTKDFKGTVILLR